MGSLTSGRAVRVSMWEIARDPTKPGALLLRDEGGATRFASRDGGRTWVPSMGALGSASERGDGREVSSPR